MGRLDLGKDDQILQSPFSFFMDIIICALFSARWARLSHKPLKAAIEILEIEIYEGIIAHSITQRNCE